MRSFLEFLATIELDTSKNKKVFDETVVTKIVVNKDNNDLHFYIKSKKMVYHGDIDTVKNDISKKLKCSPKKIRFDVRFDIPTKKDAKYILNKYEENIRYAINKRSPLTSAFKDEIEFLYINDIFKIKAPNKLIHERMIKKNIDEIVKEMISKELGIDTDVIIECAVENSNVESMSTLIEKEEDNLNKLIEKLDIGRGNYNYDSKNEDRLVVDFSEDPNMIYGDRVNAIITDISKITTSTRTIAIVGEVFDVEEQNLRNGKVLLTIYVSDNTSAIACKLYLNDMNKEKVISATKVGSYLKIKGDIVYNNYSNCIELSITGIRKEAKVLRIDDEEEKRVELHLHTQMSAMNSTVNIKQLVKTLEAWGHKAFAITDHGVVQAFPDAMNATKGKDLKVIYGVEGYLVDDDSDIIQNANDKDFGQSFVVFDIETTGFSPINDNITEIGAVLLKDGKIVDNFSSFVNPRMDIPYKVQELTGITNEMVSEADPIEVVLPRFIEFAKGAVLVAHNADFDTGFIAEKCSKLGIEYNFEKIDTLTLARVLLTKLKRVSLDKIAKELNVSLSGHHRAVNDAQATAEIFIKFVEMFEKAGAKTLSDVNKIYGKVEFSKIRPTHSTIYAQNLVGLKNLYQLISDSHLEHFYAVPRILKSKLIEHREGLIIGTACSNGELYNAVMRNKSEAEIEKILKLYDFIEIMPIDNNIGLVDSGEVKNVEELITINKKLVAIGEKYNKLVVATGNVHMLEEHEGIFRSILKYSQRSNGKFTKPMRLHLRTTREMLDEFSYLGKEKAYEVVVKNTNIVADMVEDILPIPKGTYPPKIEGSEETLRDMCYEKAIGIYGDPLPEVVKARLDRELNSIISNGYAVMYIIASKLVKKSMSDGYLVGSRGSVGSSVAATMSDITEVNPLPAHYICPNEDCKYSEFFAIGEWGSGVDLPDKICPKCGTKLNKDGHDIPFEVFLGFEGDKEPDIDLNFSGVYQPTIHQYTEELFGEGYTYRAGTIGTVKDKTAIGHVRKFSEENNLDYSPAEIKWYSKGCTGVKRTSGQHPGGVMVVPDYMDVHDFTPIQYPANDISSNVITTHFDYHSISGRILKLDILGHDGPTIIKMLEDMTGITITDIPLDDKETMSIFLNTDALGVTPEEIGTPVGSLAIPEFGTKFTRQMLIDTKPTTFAELVRISGLSHGTDVWVNNAQDLVRADIVGLKDVISTRDDIMNYLIFKGLEPKMAFTIMESVRKGKGLKPEYEEAMRKNEVPEWYISSCKKIKYMFPKAHAVAYVMTSFRIAYCKVHYPEAFYATYFTTKVEDFDIELITSGIDSVRERMEEIRAKGYAQTTKEADEYTLLEVVVEMHARGIELLKVDIYKSDAKEFKIVEKGKILPPMISLSGMGEGAALSVVEARKTPFISKEDLLKRTKLSRTVVEKLSEHGSLDNLSDENQISFKVN